MRLHLQTLFDATIVMAGNGSKKCFYHSLQGWTWPNLWKASSARARSKRCLINRETTFIYPLGFYNLNGKPRGNSNAPSGKLGCKGLFHNIYPSKPSNLALSEASAQKGERQYRRLNLTTQLRASCSGLRQRHLFVLRAVKIRSGFTWTSALIRDANRPVHSAHL